MISLNKIKQQKREQGFTIVELLIVIVVIGILALLVITTYSGIQAKARNSKRSSDVKSLQTHIEAFFSQHGYYPSRAHMNDPAWRVLPDNMKSLDKNALKDPKSSCDVDSTTGCLVASPTESAYAYAVTNSAGSSCEAAEDTCAKYTLTATFEGTVNGQTKAEAQNLD